MEIYIDAKRRDEVYGTLLETYRARQYPFSLRTTGLPQDAENLPYRIQQHPEHFAFYLLCVCYFMSATDSITAVRCMTSLYRKHPSMFRPHQVVRMRPTTIAKRLASHGLGFRENDVAVWWITNANRLIEHHNGSVLTLSHKMSDYDDACRLLLNDKKGGGLLGFQHKMVSMLLYYLMSLDLMPYFAAPLPIDFHILRVNLANEVIVTDLPPGSDLYKESMLEAMRRATLDYCLENDISWLELCDVLWPFGKAMCRNNPGNSSMQPEGYNARSTVILPLPVTWSESQQANWLRSCGSCPIAATCKWNIPSAEYYRLGRLIQRGERPTPPHAPLVFFDLNLNAVSSEI